MWYISDRERVRYRTICRICTSILRQLYVATLLNHDVHRVLLHSLTTPPPPQMSVSYFFTSGILIIFVTSKTKKIRQGLSTHAYE
jgi:hypothetical protein